MNGLEGFIEFKLCNQLAVLVRARDIVGVRQSSPIQTTLLLSTGEGLGVQGSYSSVCEQVAEFYKDLGADLAEQGWVVR